MKQQNVYCEPLCIAKEYLFDIQKVSYQEEEPYSCLMHFHEVHELIIFEDIQGSYFSSQGDSTLHNSDIVLTPALEVHNYEIGPKAKSWYLIQFLPEVLDLPQFQSIKPMFNRGMHLRMDSKNTLIVQQQTRWLVECFEQQPRSEKSLTLLSLLLLWIADQAQAVTQNSEHTLKQSHGFSRLLPVINLFKHDKYVNLSVGEAAEKCHLSTSHFSRLFKSVFRHTYANYILQHKLYHGARMLSQSKYSVTQISYEMEFSSPSHFIAHFKKYYGVTPYQYRSDINRRMLIAETA
ncbi:transcriptional regulator, AraC family [Paraglaciecola sp. T6c]|uniref:helix-turn-helix transcriptional regulator n=1 Tax=Pseudoalteromonas atlantica (strain T6c / ATCC BAA-1087) TaxID=3042615 RepID=UPI00005C5F9C|nr:AraC family transcriptional regulator [Paraglaciecola sp. T6c]ABG40823.1 transcriptional regulator, AraC family [Paraglaciecola sp. T6c]